jgi:integral membrane protein (TIGR01906 family)
VGAFRNLATILFILSIPIALVTTNIRFVANEERVYRYAIDGYDADLVTGISREELLRGGAELRRYFNNDQETLAIRVDQQGREVSLFNPRETSHLRDVKTRFQWMNRAQELSILYGLTYVAVVVLWAREVSLKRLAIQVAVGSALVLGGVVAAAAIGLSGFDQAWTNFHEVLFSGNWRFNTQTDRLIQMFPPDFWQTMVFFIGLMIVAEAALILIAAGVYLGVSSRHQPNRNLMPHYA